MAKPHLEIIIGSTRPGRAGPVLAEWINERAVAHGGFSVELVDLADVGLPLLDEPKHPRLAQYTKPHTMSWSATVARADAFVFVTPEYNHGYNAALKNALDFLFNEWADKPVGFVSYGGVAGGTRAVQQLKAVVTALRMIPVVEGVPVPFYAQLIDGDGRLQANDAMTSGADAMLTELLRVTQKFSA